jgi:hypothetical protein
MINDLRNLVPLMEMLACRQGIGEKFKTLYYADHTSIRL